MNSRTPIFPAVFAVLAITFMLGLSISKVHAAPTASDFVKNASIGNQFEIQSSQLALQKSANDNVKQFAQQMVDDHTKAGNDLASAVSSESNLPQPTGTLDSKHQKMLDKLNSLNGADFDKRYVKMQVSAHNDAVSLFKDYAKNGDDDTLKGFASSTLPTLQEHQQDIKQIKSSL